MSYKTGKSPYVLLALGVVVGGLAVASLPHIVPSAHAQQNLMRPIAGMTQENMDQLRALDNSFASLANYIEPSVVNIKSASSGGTDIFGRRTGDVGGVGTGVIFRPDGWIITNDHVVNGFDKVTITLADGRSFPGTVRRAGDFDIAVVHIDANNLPAASFGDSGKVRTGQFAMAVGFPMGLDETVTIGHVSALGAHQVIPDSRALGGERFYSDLIQTDAPINLGNSGGPLIDVDGQVIGINSAILSLSGGSQGLGFAIPSNEARSLAEMLIEKGSVTRAYLGLVPNNLKEYQMKEMGIDGGAMATNVPNDGPAAAAGIQNNDVILRIGNFNVRNQQDVRDSMLHYSPGTTVPVEVLRGNQHKTFQVKLGDGKVADEKLQQQVKQQPQDQGGFQSIPFGDMPPLGSPFGDGNQDQGTTHPHTGKAKLGVSVDTVTDAMRSQFSIPSGVQGAVVTSVAAGSIAENVGIRVGAVIEKVGDKQIRSAQDLIDALKDVNWGDTRQIDFVTFDGNSRSEQSLPVTFK